MGHPTVSSGLCLIGQLPPLLAFLCGTVDTETVLQQALDAGTLTHEETEAQRGEVTCTRIRSW